MQTCPRCGERSDQGWLCSGCTRYTRTTLRGIRSDWPDLMDAFVRARGIPTETEGHGSGGDQPLPYDEQAATVSHHIRAVLSSWVRVTVEDFRAECPPDRIGAMVAHLAGWLPTIRKQEWAGDFADEVSDLHAWLIGALQRGEGRLVTLQRASCPHCDGALTARMALDWSRNPMIRCRTCTSEWAARAWDDLKRQSDLRDATIPIEDYPHIGHPDWVTAARLGEALGVNPQVVRNAARKHGWTKRSAGGGAHGRTVVYLLADVAPWWEQRTARRAAKGA